MIDLAR